MGMCVSVVFIVLVILKICYYCWVFLFGKLILRVVSCAFSIAASSNEFVSSISVCVL